MTKSKFLCIGECMVEFAPDGDGKFQLGYAGDTFNTAWYLHRQLPADQTVSYYTAIGQDAASDKMQGFMKSAGINTDTILRDPSRTVGLYVISVDDGERSFSYWRSDSAAKTLASDDTDLTAAFADAENIYFSGITLAILNPGDRVNLLTAIKAAKSGGAKVIFDPNLRPALWYDATTMCACITKAAAISDIVLPSFDDEATHFGDPSPDATVARYLTGETQMVIVKSGHDPIVIGTPDGNISVPVHPVENMVDSTAAGDSFNAGFLGAWANGASVEDAAINGAKLAAHVVMGKGALVP